MKNVYTSKEDITAIEIPYKGNIYTTLIDTEDLPLMDSVRSWNIHNDKSGKKYVVGMTFKNKMVKLHRLVMDAPKGEIVDHIFGDTLDNRKSKLCIASHSQNMQNSKTQSNNTSGVRGLWLDKRRNRWQGEISVEGKKHFIGTWAYEDLERAKEDMELARKDYHQYSAKIKEEKKNVTKNC